MYTLIIAVVILLLIYFAYVEFFKPDFTGQWMINMPRKIGLIDVSIGSVLLTYDKTDNSYNGHITYRLENVDMGDTVKIVTNDNLVIFTFGEREKLVITGTWDYKNAVVLNNGGTFNRII